MPLLLLTAAVGACQHGITTPFPPGLEPLEDNQVPDTDSTDEVLRTVTVDNQKLTADVHGRGIVHLSPTALWPLTKNPPAMAARCSTDEQHYTENDEPDFEYSFLVHYVVHNVLTVEWDDSWRYGVVDGTDDDVRTGMIKHQKTEGSSFISKSEGTVEVLPTSDPDTSELAFVEHLDALSGSPSDLVAGMQANYDALIALEYGQPIPPCP